MNDHDLLADPLLRGDDLTAIRTAMPGQNRQEWRKIGLNQPISGT